MTKFWKVVISLIGTGLTGAIVVFLITVGSYMKQVSINTASITERKEYFDEAKILVNQVSINSDLIAANKDHSFKTARTVQVAMNRAREALEESSRAVESNNKIEKMISAFQLELNQIKTSLAVNNERSKNYGSQLKEIKKMIQDSRRKKQYQTE